MYRRYVMDIGTALIVLPTIILIMILVLGTIIISTQKPDKALKILFVSFCMNYIWHFVTFIVETDNHVLSYFAYFFYYGSYLLLARTIFIFFKSKIFFTLRNLSIVALLLSFIQIAIDLRLTYYYSISYIIIITMLIFIVIAHQIRKSTHKSFDFPIFFVTLAFLFLQFSRFLLLTLSQFELNNSDLTQHEFIYQALTIIVFNVIGILLIAESNHNNALELKAREMRLELTTQRMEIIDETDKLTRLHNRIYMDKILKLCEQGQYEFEGYLYLIDFENFRQLNIQKDYEIGNKFLVEVSAILEFRFPQSEIIRWSGNEFLVLSKESEVVSKENIDQVINRIDNLILEENYPTKVKLYQVKVDTGNTIGESLKTLEQDMIQHKKSRKPL